MMCGRYMLHADVEEILRYYGIAKGWIRDVWAPEVFPSHEVPIVIQDLGRQLVPMKWGFASPYRKGLIINSRGETVDSNPCSAGPFVRSAVLCRLPPSLSGAGRGRTKPSTVFT